jgi:hypothetical protein
MLSSRGGSQARHLDLEIQCGAPVEVDHLLVDLDAVCVLHLDQHLLHDLRLVNGDRKAVDAARPIGLGGVRDEKDGETGNRRRRWRRERRFCRRQGRRRGDVAAR